MSANGREAATSAVAGRSALVTGAASGIGLAVARHLADRGASVVLSDLAGDALQDAVADIPGARGIAANLADSDSVCQLAEQVGSVDILVNNAGLQHVAPVEEFPDKEWDHLLAVMLTAPFLLTKRLLPAMYDKGWGRVINIASVHGLIASPYKSAYVAAKHGLVGFTRVLGLEAAARCPDVTAHAICPSYVRTPLVERQVAAQARMHGIPEEEVLTDVLLAQNAVKRLIAPEEVAAMVEVLCGELGWSMTGGALAMDAGWLAH
ncbi:MAG: 3-hydroxybutyrate dehydrogenase [Mycobacteriales bacterium]